MFGTNTAVVGGRESCSAPLDLSRSSDRWPSTGIRMSPHRPPSPKW